MANQKREADTLLSSSEVSKRHKSFVEGLKGERTEIQPDPSRVLS